MMSELKLTNPIIVQTIGSKSNTTNNNIVTSFTPNLDIKLTEKIIQIHYNEVELLSNLVPKNLVEEDPNSDILIVTPNNIPETKEEIAEKINKFKDKYPEIVNVKSFKVENDQIDWLGDSLSLDKIFIPLKPQKDWDRSFDPMRIKDIDVKCFMLEEHKTSGYRGHVWFWTWKKDNYNYHLYSKLCGIYGIKGTVLATIYSDPTMKGVADALLKAVAKYGLSLGCEELVIPWPLLPMINILKKKGFTEVNTRENNIYRQFLSPLTSTSNYFIQRLDRLI